MNFQLQTDGWAAAAQDQCDALMVLVPQDFKAGRDALSKWVAQAMAQDGFDAKPAKLLAAYRPVQARAVRVLLVGIGQGSARDVRTAVQAGVSALKAAAPKTLNVAFASAVGEGALRACVLTVADASYAYTHTKSKPEPRTLEQVRVFAANGAAFQAEFDRACGIVAGVELAREWANRPPNYATPTHLGDAATELAKLPRMSCEVLGPREVAKLKMGAFMAVAQGSDQPLRLIVLRYSGARKSQAPTALVGKGITFDSGGISLKPGADMDEMKFDMAGAASVLGAFRALAALQPAINVVGIIAACENLPSGRAVKPGDVVTSMSGQTIEILNTDAEGRLILCDALTYAERFKPTAVVDIATLTGACVIALGGVRSGLYASDEALGAALVQAGERAQDLCWRMPLDEDYAEGLKTSFADVANVGPRAGGSITAAKFLQKFAQAYPWAHLDIAGTGWKSGAAKGATGRPVGLLVEFLLERAQAA